MIWKTLSLSRLQRMLKLGNSLLKKVYPRERTNIVAGQTLMKGWDMWLIDPIIHLTEARNRDWVIQVRSVETFLSNCGFSWHTWEAYKVFRMLHQQKHCQLGPKGTESGWNKEGCQAPRIPIGRKQADSDTQLKTFVILQDKRKMTLR